MSRNVHNLFDEYNEQIKTVKAISGEEINAKSDDDDPCCGCCNCLSNFADCMNSM